MVIKHNLTAMNANRMYGMTTLEQKKSTERLSSGYKVNRAADDAAGLSISEKMRKQIRGLTQASANAQDGISMVQIADGAMAEVQDMIHRGTELSVKAANGTLSAEDRSYIQQEINSLIREIDRVGTTTKFNETFVLHGDVTHSEDGNVQLFGEWPTSMNNRLGEAFTTGNLNEIVHTRATSGGTSFNGFGMTVDFSGMTMDDIEELNGVGITASCYGCPGEITIKFINGSGVDKVYKPTGAHAQTRIVEVDLSDLPDNNKSVGEKIVQKIVETTGGTAAAFGNPASHNVQAYYDADNAAKLVLFDARGGLNFDGAGNVTGVKDTTYLSWDAVNNKASVANPANGKVFDGYNDEVCAVMPLYKYTSLHVGADSSPDNKIEIKLANISAFSLGLKSAVYSKEDDAYFYRTEVDVTTAEGATTAIDMFSDATQYVASERSRMGSYQNRLEHTIKNLDNVVENTTAAESQIRDTDMATEMVKFSNNNILAQAGQAMLSQANQSNSGILSLLGR